MSIWTVEPRDTIVLRDGRPIADGAGRMRTLRMPWPSSIAGLVRTRIGTTPQGDFTLAIPAALKIAVCGPWIVDLGAPAGGPSWWGPAPADAAWLRERDAPPHTCTRFRLAPTGCEPGYVTDLAGLQIVNFKDGATHKGKPVASPALWRGDRLLEWLRDPASVTQFDCPRDGAPSARSWRIAGSAEPFGISSPPVESRTHVKLDPNSGTADEGMLFVTESLRTSGGPADVVGRFAFAFATTDDRLRDGVVPLGGERRPSFLRRGLAEHGPACDAWTWIPETATTLRVVLITPALFEEGSVPKEISGARVVAAAVGRAEHVSGWDLAAHGPKPVRRAAPAGSVYWVEVPERETARDWAARVWMTCVSSTERDRLDGFGLALVGVA